MRTILLFSVMIGATAAAAPTDQPLQELPKPSPTIGTYTPGPSRPPSIFWRRGMSQKAAQPVHEPEQSTVPPVPAIPDIEVRHPSPIRLTVPSLPPPPVFTGTPARPVRSRDQILQSLVTLHTGSSKAEVLAKLGEPAYSIGIPEAGHFVERCRFRTGTENLAAIEFRDGLVSGIDRIAP